jgi:hypothetical protein
MSAGLREQTDPDASECVGAETGNCPPSGNERWMMTLYRFILIPAGARYV